MLIKRIIAGILVGTFFASMLAWACGPVLAVMLLALAVITQLEFYKLAKGAGYEVYPVLGTILGSLWFIADYFLVSYFEVNGMLKNCDASTIAKVLLIAIFFVISLKAMFDDKQKRHFESVAITMLGIVYLPVLLSYFFRIVTLDSTASFVMTRSSVFLAFFMIIVIKISDTGAFAVGTTCAKTCGTHPLFPRVSPKKSYEGLLGGILAGCGVGAFVAHLAAANQWGPDGIFWATEGVAAISMLKAVIISAVLVAIGVFGDLIESMFKRAASIKDSAALFPGMGGLLDVIDSLLFAPAIFYIILKLNA